MDFRVGDRVICKGLFAGEDLANKIGTVVWIDKHTNELAVDFDESFPVGHDCGGKARHGHGRYGFGNEIELLVNEPVITLSFNEVMGI